MIRQKELRMVKFFIGLVFGTLFSVTLTKLWNDIVGAIPALTS